MTDLKILAFEKRPEKIQAVRLDEHNIYAAASWSGGYVAVRHQGMGVTVVLPRLYPHPTPFSFAAGDWIVRDELGDHYGYLADVFEETFRYVGVVRDPGQTELPLGV